MSGVTVACHAKLNLFLRILAREDDGFHSVETLFCLLDLSDRLVAERREQRGVTIEVTGADAGPAADNLALRAAQLVLAATGERFGSISPSTNASPSARVSAAGRATPPRRCRR